MPKPNKKKGLQDEAIKLLALGGQMLDTARKIGVNESTLHRWMHDSEFKRMLEEAKTKFMQASLADGAGKLIEQLKEQLKPLAVNILRIAQDVNATPAARVAASAEYRNLIKHITAITFGQESGSGDPKKSTARPIGEHKGDPRGILRAVEK